MTALLAGATVGVPAVGAVLALLVGDEGRAVAVGRATAAALVVVAMVLCGRLLQGDGAPVEVLTLPWMPSLGVDLALAVDGLGAPFLLLGAAQALALMVGAGGPFVERRAGYVAATLAMTAVLDLLFLAADLVTFFLAWELTLVPVHALLAGWGTGPERRAAAARYSLTMLVGGVPLLLGLLVLAQGGCSFSMAALRAAPAPEAAQALGGALVLAGLAFKVPAPGLHGWLPPALTEGPAPVAVWMVGLKLGAWALLRLLVPLAPAFVTAWAPEVALLGLVGVAWGALLAFDQRGLRRLLAFSGLSHVGFVVLAVAAGTGAALQGAAVQLISFGLGAASLALLIDALRERLGTTDRAALGGLAVVMPRWTTLMVLATAVAVGLPGTVGFVGELLIVLGAFPVEPGLVLLALAALGVGAAAQGEALVAAVGGRPERPGVAALEDLTAAELASIGPLLLAALALGVAPGPLLALTGPALAPLAALLGR